MVSRLAILLPGLLGCLASGCAVRHTMGPRSAEVPVEVVAYLCADVCRTNFPAADPLPYHAGAPATRLSGDSFEVRYDRRADGRWSPRAEGRLLARNSANPTDFPAVRYQPVRGLPGFPSPTATVTVYIHLRPHGTEVEVATSGTSAESLVDHLHGALRMAAGVHDDSLPEPCCSKHAPWQAYAFARRANEQQQAGNLLAARDSLRAARAVQPELPGIQRSIGELDRMLGQNEVAVARLVAATRRARDPGERASAAMATTQSLRRLKPEASASLRTAATQQISVGNLSAAAALAHQARMARPDPIADLRLRHDLQRARGDHGGAMGTALLMREYGGGTEADKLLVRDLARTGQDRLARRAAARCLGHALGEAPQVAQVRRAIRKLQTSAGPAAAPPR
ncbi:MAG: hypothetical protein VYE77_10505 [Planctomycetota bacterium]|nr:hypothetical protein [Planctomycetota bacterium]